MRVTPYAKCRNVFDELPNGLLEKSKPILLERGDTLYSKGESPRGFYYIESGLIALVNISPNGNESLLRVFTNQFFIGYRSFVAQDQYHATAQALEASKVYRIPIESIETLKFNYPSVHLHITQMLARDLRIAEERLNDLSGKRVLSRIIDALIFLKQRKQDYAWTRREVGEFCGAKTETVTRAFKKLEEQELIKKEGREVNVIDMDKLLDYKVQVDLED